MKNTAKLYLKNNLNPVPIRKDTKAPSLKELAPLYTNLFPEKDFFLFEDKWIGIIPGKISNNLEVIDIDNKSGLAQEAFHSLKYNIDKADPNLWNILTIERTPSGGYHLYYRCNEINIPGSKVYAKALKKGKTDENINNNICPLVESLGENSICVCSPTPGYEPIQNKLPTIFTITKKQRAIIINCSKDQHRLNKIVEEQVKPENYNHRPENEKSDIIADFNQIDGTDILLRNGWSVYSGGKKGSIYLTRPGKSTKEGNSATYFFNKNPHMLRVHSSSTEFTAGQNYNNHAILAILEHKGDFRAATKAIAEYYGVNSKKNNLKEIPNTPLPSKNYLEEMPPVPESAIPKSQNQKQETTTKKKLKKKKHTSFFDKKITNEDHNYTHFSWIENQLNSTHTFRKNIITGMYEFASIDTNQYKILEDEDINEFVKHLNRIAKGNDIREIKESHVNTVIKSYFAEKYNPIKEYFLGLPDWNEKKDKDYIGELLELLHVPADQSEMKELYFRRWLVALVACAVDNIANHTCIIMHGKQGNGKTTFINKLVPKPLNDYYSIQPITANKDNQFAITENFLINIDEFDSLRREEIGELKRLITLPEIKQRRPYAKRPEVCKRTASFIATINKDNFLTDLTGTRRFLPITIDKVDYKENIDMNKVYAQAYKLYKTGAKYYFDGDDLELINNNNSNYEVKTNEEELINKWLSYPDVNNVNELTSAFPDNVFMTSNEIRQHLEYKSGKEVKLKAQTIGMLLARMGYSKGTNRISRNGNNIPVKGWIVKLNQEPAHYEKNPVNNFIGLSNQDYADLKTGKYKDEVPF